MKQIELVMGMPITVEVDDPGADERVFAEVFEYFRSIDAIFSTYKSDSEISRINRGETAPRAYSADVQEILVLAEKARTITYGYFNIATSATTIDPSGIVKGWAIEQAADLLAHRGLWHYYVNAGGDVAMRGGRANGAPWRVGIQNPFAPEEIVKTVALMDGAVATSGTYIRGDHIYDPHEGNRPATEIMSMTVIGSSIRDADVYATAAFAMGKRGITFIEALSGFEGYQIDHDGIATMTSGFETYTTDHEKNS